MPRIVLTSLDSFPAEVLPNASVPESVDDSEMVDKVALLLRQMSPRDSEIFEKRAIRGATLREVARAVGMSAEGARKRYRTICQKLRDALDAPS